MTAASSSTPRLRVALLGFSDFERAALASYFRLAGDRFPAYEQTESIEDARFIVADADHPGAVQQVQAAGRVGDTVFIGGQAPEGALAWRLRPIDPLQVLRELDAHVALLRLAVRRPAADRAALPARRASDVPLPPRDVSPDALVVGDNEAALRALERQLQGLGLTVARAGTSGKALELCARLAFRFVFIDTDLGPSSELDAFALCEQLQQRSETDGDAAPPTICLVSGRGEASDGVRAAVAGCDAFLAEPIDEAALRRVLNGRGVVPRAAPAARAVPPSAP
jgi:CheY-like chemotaxis protein